jgi:hypothetical protein
MPISSTVKRARRLERRCIPAVVEALYAGQISPRSADVFLRLDPRAQAAELERRLSETREREQRHAVVAQTIRAYLDSGVKVDLLELSQKIRAAIA